MAKEQEMYEGMPVIEATDTRTMERKLEKMEARPTAPYVVRFPKKTTKIKKEAFNICNSLNKVVIPNPATIIAEDAFPNSTEIIRKQSIIYQIVMSN